MQGVILRTLYLPALQLFVIMIVIYELFFVEVHHQIGISLWIVEEKLIGGACKKASAITKDMVQLVKAEDWDEVTLFVEDLEGKAILVV